MEKTFGSVLAEDVDVVLWYASQCCFGGCVSRATFETICGECWGFVVVVWMASSRRVRSLGSVHLVFRRLWSFL